MPPIATIPTIPTATLWRGVVQFVAADILRLATLIAHSEHHATVNQGKLLPWAADRREAIMIRKLACGWATGLVMAGQASAVTVIDFDNLPAGTVLNNQYAAQGVTFVANAFSGPGNSGSGQSWAPNSDMTLASVTGDNNEVGDLGTPSLVGGNVLHRFGGWTRENGDPSFRIDFSTPVSSVSLTFAGLAGAQFAPHSRLFIYDGAVLLTTLAASLPNANTGQLTLSYAAAHITHVAVAPGSYNDWVAVDNLVFAPVPEPGPLALMALGLGVLAHARRRSAR